MKLGYNTYVYDNQKETALEAAGNLMLELNQMSRLFPNIEIGSLHMGFCNNGLLAVFRHEGVGK